jgi:hypothetical protein
MMPDNHLGDYEGVRFPVSEQILSFFDWVLAPFLVVAL